MTQGEVLTVMRLLPSYGWSVTQLAVKLSMSGSSVQTIMVRLVKARMVHKHRFVNGRVCCVYYLLERGR